MSRNLEVRLLDKSFVFEIPDEINRDEFIEIINYLEDKLKKIKSQSSGLDSFKITLLAAINITEELFTLKHENQKLVDLLKKIDSAFQSIEKKDKVPIKYSS